MLAVLAINVVTFVMMVTASYLSGSSALLSGTLDNLGDAVTYALSFAVVGASVQAKARVALFKGLMILGAAVAESPKLPDDSSVPAMSPAALLALCGGLAAAAAWVLRAGREAAA